jgi:hypothetical protein
MPTRLTSLLSVIETARDESRHRQDIYGRQLTTAPALIHLQRRGEEPIQVQIAIILGSLTFSFANYR